MNQKYNEQILKYLENGYHCGWNNTVRLTETNEVVDLNKLIAKIMGVFSVKRNVAESCIMYFLIQTTEDVSSIIDYWSDNFSEHQIKRALKTMGGSNGVDDEISEGIDMDNEDPEEVERDDLDTYARYSDIRKRRENNNQFDEIFGL